MVIILVIIMFACITNLQSFMTVQPKGFRAAKEETPIPSQGDTSNPPGTPMGVAQAGHLEEVSISALRYTAETLQPQVYFWVFLVLFICQFLYAFYTHGFTAVKQNKLVQMHVSFSP